MSIMSHLVILHVQKLVSKSVDMILLKKKLSEKIQHFYFSEYNSEDIEESNPHGNYDFIFDTYQNRDEINQNLSNAPSSSVRINSSDNNFIPIATVTTNYQSNDHSYNVPSNNCFWNPTRELCNLLNEFNNKILFDYPKIPCAYCSIFLMQDSIKWLVALR